MKYSINQQIRHLEKQEQKILNKQVNPLIKSTIMPFMDKVQDIIPDKLETVLNTAFYKGFQLVFKKGSPYIEKTYNKERIQMEFDINNYAVDKEVSKLHMKRLDKKSSQSSTANSSFAVFEGGILGLLGIGLPDIPLFLSVIVKTIYEIALSYGFSYNTDEEEAFILLLISASIAKGDKQKDFDRDLENLGAQIDQNIVIDVDPDSYMKVTSEILSDALLTAKFIQGFPVVGVVGGAVNYNIINKISSYARIKYKKRYLKKKLPTHDR